MDLIGKVFSFNNFLTAANLKDLQDHVDRLTFTQPSFVYHRENEENVIDTEVRKSQTVTVDDAAMLQFVKDKVLTAVTAQEHKLVLKLARDHVTFIKYQEGGFFDWHQDFEKYIIDGRRKWIEMHLLICLQEPTKGGELLVQMQDDQGLIHMYPQTTNGCIIFDKNMMHRGDLVTEGSKTIMTVDVLVSTLMIQEPSVDIDLELEPLMMDGCLSYRHDVIKTYVDQFRPPVVYGLLKSVSGTLTKKVIYDSHGAYHIEVTDTEGYVDDVYWTRGTKNQQYDYPTGPFINSFKQEDGLPLRFCWDDVMAFMTGETDINIVSGTVDFARLSSYDPIPDGTEVELLLDLKIIHVPETPNDVSYTYHCNEPSYGTTEILSLMGFMY